LTGWLKTNSANEVFAPAEQDARANTFVSGCAVPIWEVDDNDNSIFPAAAFTHVNAMDLRV